MTHAIELDEGRMNILNVSGRYATTEEMKMVVSNPNELCPHRIKNKISSNSSLC